MLFVDLVGSTQLASTIPASEVVNLLNEFFRVIVDTVNKHGGFVNKFQGDAALAIFGAPIEQRRRKAGGHFRRHFLLHELAATDHAAGIVSQQQADLIFGLLNLLLQRGDGLRRGADQLLRLAKVE